MDTRFVFGVGLAVVIFTLYYLEKELSKREIFWLYSGLSVLLGAVSTFYVAYDKANYEYYIAMAVIFVLMAMFYFDEGEDHAGRAA